ncbi:MAG: hypothetical protein IAF02_03230 [Anaerolineae bacterium]|nr:hypothetical protein [Anaerolineae bacterium]
MKRILIVLLLISLAACTAVSEKPTINEAEVYTAVIQQIYTVDDTFGGTLQPPLVYLLSQTDDSVGDPNIEQQPAQMIDEASQQAIVAGLAELPAEWVWVNGRSDVPITEDGQVEGDGVIITLGNIHPQADGTVQVSASIYVANLAAGGQTFILEQTDSGWVVSGTTGVQWIS